MRSISFGIDDPNVGPDYKLVTEAEGTTLELKMSSEPLGWTKIVTLPSSLWLGVQFSDPHGIRLFYKVFPLVNDLGISKTRGEVLIDIEKEVGAWLKSEGLDSEYRIVRGGDAFAITIKDKVVRPVHKIVWTFVRTNDWNNGILGLFLPNTMGVGISGEEVVPTGINTYWRALFGLLAIATGFVVIRKGFKIKNGF